MSEQWLFKKRERVPTEPRVEVLTAYDRSGNETWEDLQDYLDRVLIIPDALRPVTLREFKNAWAPHVLSDQDGE